MPPVLSKKRTSQRPPLLQTRPLTPHGLTVTLFPMVLAVIPVRYASTRFPGKPLADIHGKPMIQHVVERVRQAKGIDRIIVATDDTRIQKAVQQFAAQLNKTPGSPVQVVMTSPELPSGTDRVAAVADQTPADLYVNIQGDEPLIDPKAIEAALALTSKYGLATVMTRLKSPQELDDPSVVKVIADRQGRALYFSRLPIPYTRGPRPPQPKDYVCQRHVGLYVYDHSTLKRLQSLPPSPLEQAELLEQLRAMQDGIPIGIAEVDFTSVGVDTPEDLEKVRRLLV